MMAQLRFMRDADEFHAAVNHDKWRGKDAVVHDALNRFGNVDFAHFHTGVVIRNLPDQSSRVTAA